MATRTGVFAADFMGQLMARSPRSPVSKPRGFAKGRLHALVNDAMFAFETLRTSRIDGILLKTLCCAPCRVGLVALSAKQRAYAPHVAKIGAG